MKKIICLLIALLVCSSMVLTAFAAEAEFVPSVTYKENPVIVEAVINGEDVTDCIVLTSVSQARDKSTDITQEERDILLKVYEELSNGATLPIEEDHVIRYLLDVNFKYGHCRENEEHDQKDEQLAPTGVTIEVTLDLGVDAYTDFVVMSYKNGAWGPIVSATNNGDGTITCVFEHFCPGAFAVKYTQASEENPKTGDAAAQPLLMWGGLLGASAVGMIVVVAVYTKKRKHA